MLVVVGGRCVLLFGVFVLLLSIVLVCLVDEVDEVHLVALLFEVACCC